MKQLLTLLMFTLCLGITPGAHSREGFSHNVINQCRIAGRIAPAFPAEECLACHNPPAGRESENNLNNSGVAYRAGRVLNTFCPDAKLVVNTAPMVNAIGKKSARAGKALKVVVTAKDPQKDAITLEARDLPPGAFFSDQGNSGNKRKGVLTWTPAAEFAGQSFMVTVIATEVARDPALQVARSFAIKVKR